VVEGDDGLFTVDLRAPTASDFSDLGMTIKLEMYNFLSEASFCGMVFDTECFQAIADPVKMICNFSWISRQYLGSSEITKKCLLRAKALSYIYQYPFCPVIRELCLWALRMTPQITDRQIRRVLSHMKDEATRAKLLNFTHPIKCGEIQVPTRLLMERVFHVSVASQLRIEGVLRNKNDFASIQDQLFDFVPEIYFQDYNQYCVDFAHSSSLIQTPHMDNGAWPMWGVLCNIKVPAS